MKWIKKRNQIKTITIIAFLLSIGSLSWVVYGNDDTDITYNIQEEVVQQRNAVNLILEVSFSDKVTEISKIIVPDGSYCEKQNIIMYEVTENGEYTFIVHYKIAKENEENYDEVEMQETITYQVNSIQEKQVEDDVVEAVEDKAIIDEKKIDEAPVQKQAELEAEVYVEGIAINEEHFPDAVFRNWLVDKNNINGYGQDKVLTSNEIANITSIIVNNIGLSSLQGIEHFNALTTLQCYGNQLTELDISNNKKLTTLYCYNNQLTELNSSQNASLVSIHCVGNQIVSLDVSNNPLLEYLYCSANKLTKIDISKNKALLDLRCNDNKFAELNISNNIALKTLICGENQLTKLDLSKNTALNRLDCQGNLLTTINLANQSSLVSIDMSNQRIEIPMEYSNGSWKSNASTKYQLSSISANTIVYNSATGQFTTTNTSTSTTSFTTNCNDGKGVNRPITGTIYFQYQGVELNAINFPDTVFRNWLLNRDNIDGYGVDGVLTSSELVHITHIDIRNMQIANVKGIEFFTFLDTFHCENNTLNSLDVSKNTELAYLYCNNNQITSLQLSNHGKLIEVIADKQTCHIPMMFENGEWKSSSAYYVVDSIDTSEIVYDASIGQFIAKNTAISSTNFTTNCKDKNGIVHTVEGSLYFEFNGIEINEEHFPDAVFRNWLVDKNNINGYGEDKVLTNNEIANITSIMVNNIGISSLQGIEHFTALMDLQCYGNQLTKLDISNNKKLTSLYCHNNQLTELDISKNEALVSLLCVTNQITTLDVSNNLLLEYLYCSANKLTKIDVSKNKALVDLRCDGNLFTSLDTSNNTGLRDLICGDNLLTNLDISKNTLLVRLNCKGNRLTTINLANQSSLVSIDMSDQRIEVPMTNSNQQWRSNPAIRYQLGSIDASYITYYSSTGQFSAARTVAKSSGFFTNCIDGSGTARQISGTIHFTYEGFVPVSTIKEVPKSLQVEKPLTLVATVSPDNATEKEIIWSIKDVGTTGAQLSGNTLTVSGNGTVVLTATVLGGLETGNYIQDFTIVTYVSPSILVSIPTNIQLEKEQSDSNFEAIKEEMVSLLPSTNTSVFGENFYIKTDPSFALLHTTNSDEWFNVQIYDESNNKHPTKETPLAVLNSAKRSQKFYIKARKDIARQKGMYQGTMNFIIGYGEGK